MRTRTVLITGAARGIGAATASLFRAQGWEVVGVDRDWPEGSAGVTLDLADGPAWGDFLNGVRTLDALVNNAAINRGVSIGSPSERLWRETLAVNVEAAAQAISRLSPLLADRHGSVVNVASVHALTTTSGSAAYATSKAALMGLTRAAAVELGVSGVRVNAVLPGAIETSSLLPQMSADERRKALARLRRRTPLRRVGEPDEVAETIFFLADGRRSSFVTGACLSVDGGATARLATE